MAKEALAEKARQVFGGPLLIRRGEDVPELLQALFAECERRNNSNPDLVKIGPNTWDRKS